VWDLRDKLDELNSIFPEGGSSYPPCPDDSRSFPSFGRLSSGFPDSKLGHIMRPLATFIEDLYHVFRNSSKRIDSGPDAEAAVLASHAVDGIGIMFRRKLPADILAIVLPDLDRAEQAIYRLLTIEIACDAGERPESHDIETATLDAGHALDRLAKWKSRMQPMPKAGRPVDTAVIQRRAYVIQRKQEGAGWPEIHREACERFGKVELETLQTDYKRKNRGA
jgi:hypothetical protein